ncbi:MAG: phosphonate C-P lyase system protein PhnG [Pseudomonadota bacterium]
MSEGDAERKAWLGTLARAPAEALAARWAALGLAPTHDLLRPPEIGAVMVRGRAGGTGAPFNLGEMTVTRCSVRLADGTVGHGWVPGRDGDHATRVALCDALLQTAEAARVQAEVVAPLAAAAEAKTAAEAAKAAGTKVEFFTLVRGEDRA